LILVLWRWFGAVVMIADASGSLNSLLLRVHRSTPHGVENFRTNLSRREVVAGSWGAVPQPEQSGA
jgi:hypothetical protein